MDKKPPRLVDRAARQLLKMFGHPDYQETEQEKLQYATKQNRRNAETAQEAATRQEYAQQLALDKAAQDALAEETYRKNFENFYKMAKTDPRSRFMDVESKQKNPEKWLVNEMRQKEPSAGTLNRFYASENQKLGQRAIGALGATANLDPDSPEYKAATANAFELFKQREGLVPSRPYDAANPGDRLRPTPVPVGKIKVPLELTGNLLDNEEYLPEEKGVRRGR